MVVDKVGRPVDENQMYLLLCVFLSYMREQKRIPADARENSSVQVIDKVRSILQEKSNT